jgi:hypothetical protein
MTEEEGVMSSMRTRRFAWVAWLLAVAALVVSSGATGGSGIAAGAGVTTETADVVGQGSGGAVVSDDGATLQRSATGLSARLSMPTPEPGTYMYPPAQTAPFPFPAAVPGHPEAYSFWVFVFNYPEACSMPCDSNDLGVDAPAQGGAFNAGGHPVGGPNLNLSGHLSMNSAPFSGSPLLEPLTAEVHLAVAPHGALDPTLLPDQITQPIGSPPFWWSATFK